ncbi:hypothetical protein BsWGS_27131 [Bradybaena similaris]
MARLCLLVVMFVMSLVSGLHIQSPWEETDSEPASPSSRTLSACGGVQRVNCGQRPGFSNRYDGWDTIVDDTDDGLDKIIGGSEAQRGEFPWIARVVKVDVVDGVEHATTLCAGAIINQYWILTAALCRPSSTTPLSALRIVVGNHNVSVWETRQQVFRVANLVTHGSFRGGATYFDYNIALYKIAPTSHGCGIRYNSLVQPICIPEDSVICPNSGYVVTAGWGYTHNGQEGTSRVLNRVTLQCQDVFECGQHVFHGESLTERMFCAGEKHGHTDACTADIGGPAVYLTRGRFVLAGIISHGTLCYSPNTKVVMTNVPKYRKWVLGTINAVSAGDEDILPDDNIATSSFRG